MFVMTHEVAGTRTLRKAHSERPHEPRKTTDLFNRLALKQGDLFESLAIFRHPLIHLAFACQFDTNHLYLPGNAVCSRVAAVDVEWAEIVPDKDYLFQRVSLCWPE